MSDTISKSLQDYGTKILPIKDASQIPEPEFSVQSQNVLNLFKLITNNSDSPLDIGIYCALPTIIRESWPALKQEEKDSLKAALITSSHNKINKIAMGRFADSYILTYQLSNFKWPEFADLIFKTSPKFELIGFLFVRYCSTCNSAFFKQKAADIVSIITELLDKAQTSVQTGLIIVFSNLDIQKVLQQNPDFYENIWRAILNVYANDAERIKVLSQAIDNMYEKVPVLIDADPKVVTDAIAALSNDLAPAKPLIQLMCYFSASVLKTLLTKLKNMTSPPTEIIEMLYNSSIADVQPQIMEEICAFLQPCKTDIDFALFAPFAAVNKTQTILTEILDDKKVVRVLIGLKALELMAKDNVDQDFIPDDAVLDKTVLYLTHANQEIALAAFSAMKSLIENDVFIQLDDCVSLLAAFEKVAEPNKPLYFKLVSSLLKVDAVEDDIVDKIFDFAYLLIRNHPQYSIDCLHLFNVMFFSAEREDLLTPIVDELLPFSIKIINDKDPKGLVQALRSVALFVSLEDSIDKKKITPLFPIIFDIADNGQTSKIKAEAATSMVTIALKFDDESLYQRCFNFISTFSKQPHEIALVRACSKIGHSMLNTKFAGPSLDLLCEDALHTTDPSALNSLLRAIKNLMTVATSPKVLDLLESLLTGAHPIYRRKDPANFVDRETQILKFFVRCCSYEPSRAPMIIEILVRRIHDVPISMFVVYLRAINKFDSIPTPLASDLARLLARSMDGSTPTIDENVLDTIMKLIRNDKTVYNIDILASQMSYYWDNMKDEGGWRAAVGTAILELAGLGAEVDNDIIVDVLADYPFSTQIGRCENASKGLVAIMNNTTRNNTEIAPIVAKCLADVLTLSVPKMRDLELTETTRNEMKRVLKAIFDHNTAIRDEIAKAYQEPERLHQRFQTLL